MSAIFKTQGGSGGFFPSIFATGLSETDTVSAAKDGKTVRGKWTQKPLLPDGYTQLEYIESTGTQYIDTGVKGKSTLRLKMKAQMIDNSISTPFLFGARDSGTDAVFCMFFHTSSGAAWKCDYQTSANRYTFSNTVATKTGVLEIDANRNAWTVNGLSKTFTAAAFTSGSNLVLSAINTGGVVSDHAPVKIFYCQIYDNGTLIRDFVPCINPDGEVGMYDLANDVFYTNSGTGDFVAGAEIPSTIDGFLISPLRELGMWTVTATNGTNTATQDVLVDVATEFEVEMTLSA